MSERKSFQHLPGHENPHFLEDGKKIYLQLLEKYSDGSVESLDNILNILCCSLLCLIKKNVKKDESYSFLQLVYKILSYNVSKME